MPTNRSTRRTVLRGLGSAAAVGSLAGCLDLLGDSDTVLDSPEHLDVYGDAEPPYPIHGDELPEATVPDPVVGRDVTTTEFVGDRHVLATFVFTRCPGVCPALMSNLRQVQADAAEEGYTDEVALLLFTFDPEHDTADVLAAYGDDYGVDREAGNWYFLRPETEQRAEEVVRERFGVYFARLSEEEREEYDMHEDMKFDHASLILLANADGYVERGYTGSEVPNPGSLVEDVRTLRDRW